MIVHLNNDTYRVQFIKEVEERRGGRTTIKTICKIFKYLGRNEFGDHNLVWELFSTGVARQNPLDKHDHLVGKRVALRNAMIKEVINDQVDGPDALYNTLSMDEWLNYIEEEPEVIYHFDRVDRCVFASMLEAEFGER